MQKRWWLALLTSGSFVDALHVFVHIYSERSTVLVEPFHLQNCRIFNRFVCFHHEKFFYEICHKKMTIFSLIAIFRNNKNDHSTQNQANDCVELFPFIIRCQQLFIIVAGITVIVKLCWCWIHQWKLREKNASENLHRSQTVGCGVTRYQVYGNRRCMFKRLIDSRLFFALFSIIVILFYGFLLLILS